MADIDNMGAASTGDRSWLSRTAAWYCFLAAMIVASFLPIIVFPATYHVLPVKLAFYFLAVITMLGATFHVAVTGWFFTDPVMRGHFRVNRLRYFVAPVFVIGGSALAFQYLDGPAASYLLMAYLAWQLWHYQKQNFGVLSLVSAGTDRVPLSTWERRTLGLAAVPGILGFFRFFDVGLPDRMPEFLLAHRVGLAAYALVAASFVTTLIKAPHLRANHLRLAFFTYGTLFFLPTYLFTDAPSAIAGFAIAHGLQYLVIMSIVSGRTPRPLPSLAALLAIGALGYLLLERGIALRGAHTGLPYAGALYGASLGIVMTHFIMDADIWRLREKFQNGYVRAKLNFIFNR